MEYNGFLIEEDNTGIAPKNSRFHFYISGDEVVTGWGESVEDCEKQIDQLNLDTILEDANLLESEFLKWIKTKGWMYINPLDIYQHKNLEIYRTKSELKDIFLSQRHS
jgi:hypothetical protein